MMRCSRCTGSNTFASLGSAVLSAAFRAGSDEIRLTNTISYTGNSNRLDLAGWNNFGPGTLVIAGGYDNCFGSVVGRSRIGDPAGRLTRNRRVGFAHRNEFAATNATAQPLPCRRTVRCIGGWHARIGARRGSRRFGYAVSCCRLLNLMQ